MMERLRRGLVCAYCGRLLAERWVWEREFPDHPACDCRPVVSERSGVGSRGPDREEAVSHPPPGASQNGGTNPHAPLRRDRALRIVMSAVFYSLVIVSAIATWRGGNELASVLFATLAVVKLSSDLVIREQERTIRRLFDLLDKALGIDGEHPV